MGLRPMGTVSRARLSGLSPLGVVDDREVFRIAGAEDDDSAGKDGEDTDSDDDEDDSSDEEDDEDDKPAAKRSRHRGRNDRSSEFNRIRRERNALLKEKTDREKQDRAAELKGKTEAERATAERDDAVKERDELSSKYSEALTELEIIKASNRKKYAWNDLEDVLNDRALRKAIEIGDDGEITGVEEALKDLAKRKPHFLSKSEQDGKQGDGKTGDTKSTAGTNGKTGGQPNSGSGGNGDRAADRQRLAQLYPALQRLPQ